MQSLGWDITDGLITQVKLDEEQVHLQHKTFKI